MIGVEVPLAIAVHADLVVTAASPVADHRYVSRLTEVSHDIAGAPLAVAAKVEIPHPAAEDANRLHAAARPISHHRHVARIAELEDVVDQVGPHFSMGTELHPPF